MIGNVTIPPPSGRPTEARPMRDEAKNPDAKLQNSSFADALAATQTGDAPERESKPSAQPVLKTRNEALESPSNRLTMERRQSSEGMPTARQDRYPHRINQTSDDRPAPMPARVDTSKTRNQAEDDPSSERIDAKTSETADRSPALPEACPVVNPSPWPPKPTSSWPSSTLNAADGPSPDGVAESSPTENTACNTQPRGHRIRFTPDAGATRHVVDGGEIPGQGETFRSFGVGGTSKDQRDVNGGEVPAFAKATQPSTDLRTQISAETVVARLTDAIPQWASPLAPPTGSANAFVQSDVLSLTTRVLPSAPDFATELSTDIQLMLSDGVGRAELSLNPVDLGPIFIELKVTAHIAEVAFSVANPATRDAIAQSMPQLNDLLANNGVTLGQASVTDNPRKNGRENEQSNPGRHPSHPAVTTRSQEAALPTATGHRQLMALAAAMARGGIDHYA